MDNIVGKEKRSFWMGVSITIVTFFHFVSFTSEAFSDTIVFNAINPIFCRGYIGVDIFFFLSAYGLCHSYEGKSVGRYYMQRLLKIFPLYIVFLFIFGLYSYGKDLDLLTNSLYQLTGLSVISNGLNTREWFIPALLLLYYFFPLLFELLKFQKPSNSNFSLIIQMTVLILLHFACQTILPNIIQPLFVNRFPIIVAAIYLYINQKNGKKDYIPVLFGVMALFTIWIRDMKSGLVYDEVLPLILFAFSHINIKKNIFCRYLSYLGKYTLEIYLAQTICLSIYLDYVHYNVISDIDTNVLVFAIAILSTFIITILFCCITKIQNKYIR